MKNKPNFTQFTFDEMQQVVYHLRHSCDNIEKVPQAIHKIAHITNFHKDKIESILIQVGDNNPNRLEKVLIKD